MRTFNEKLNRNSVFCSSTFSFKPQGFTQSPGVSEDVFFQTLRNKSERGTGGFITGEEERRDGARGEICWLLRLRLRPGLASPHLTTPATGPQQPDSSAVRASPGGRKRLFVLSCIIVAWPVRHLITTTWSKVNTFWLSYYFIIGPVYQEENSSHYIMTITLSIFVQYTI